MRRLFRPLTKITKGWIIVFLVVSFVPWYVAWGETREDNADLSEQLKTEAAAHQKEIDALKASHADAITLLKEGHRDELADWGRVRTEELGVLERRYEARIIGIEELLDSQRRAASIVVSAALQEQIFLDEGLRKIANGFLVLAGDSEWEIVLSTGGMIKLKQETNGSFVERKIEFHR